MRGDKDAILNFSPAVTPTDPEITPGGLDMEKLAARIRLETRKDCLARIESYFWQPQDLVHCKSPNGVDYCRLDRDTLIRVLGLGMGRL